MNDIRDAAYNHGSNGITCGTDLAHIVEMLTIAYGRSWISWRMSWMRKCEEVGLNISKTSVRIYMQLIAGRQRWNMMGQCHLSVR